MIRGLNSWIQMVSAAICKNWVPVACMQKWALMYIYLQYVHKPSPIPGTSSPTPGQYHLSNIWISYKVESVYVFFMLLANHKYTNNYECSDECHICVHTTCNSCKTSWSTLMSFTRMYIYIRLGYTSSRTSNHKISHHKFPECDPRHKCCSTITLPTTGKFTKCTNPTFYYELIQGEIAPQIFQYEHTQKTRNHNQGAQK